MKIVLSLLAVCLVWGCTAEPDAHIRKHQVLAFGTIIDITIRHHDDALIERALHRLETDFRKMHEIWHPWKPGTLSRTNQLLRSGEWFTASTSVLPLILRSQQLAAQSSQYFNPAIGELVRLWGFHRDNADQPYQPDITAINAVKADMPDMEDVEINGITMRGLNPNIRIDLGGIAKGYGIDQAIELLQGMGIQHAIINAGGDLRAIGQHPDRPWKIGIQHPREPVVLASIETIKDESIFTSGDYQRFYLQENHRRHHIIDPISGAPVSHTMAATVIHSQATVADAAATALLSAGAGHAGNIAKAMGITHFMLLTADGDLVFSQPMQQRLDLNENIDLNLRLLDL